MKLFALIATFSATLFASSFASAGHCEFSYRDTAQHYDTLLSRASSAQSERKIQAAFSQAIHKYDNTWIRLWSRLSRSRPFSGSFVGWSLNDDRIQCDITRDRLFKCRFLNGETKSFKLRWVKQELHYARMYIEGEDYLFNRAYYRCFE